MVGRTGGGAERAHLVHQKFPEGLGIEQRLGLLIQVALVGAAAALGDEEKLVFAARGGVDVNLGRQVAPSGRSRLSP